MQELQLARAAADLSNLERQLTIANERATEADARAVVEADGFRASLAALQAETEKRPSKEAYDALASKAESLLTALAAGNSVRNIDGSSEAELTEAAAELLAAAGSTGSSADGSGSSMNTLLVANNHRLQTDLALARNQLADVQSELSSWRVAHAKVVEQLAEQASTIQALEDTLLQQQAKRQAWEAHGTTDGTTSAATLSAVLGNRHAGYLMPPTPGTPSQARVITSGVTVREPPHVILPSDIVPGAAGEAGAVSSGTAIDGNGKYVGEQVGDALKLVCQQRERARRQVGVHVPSPTSSCTTPDAATVRTPATCRSSSSRRKISGLRTIAQLK